MISAQIGSDIGQKRDPTAISVAVPRWRNMFGRRECHYHIRFLERMRIGTTYPEVATRLHDVKQKLVRMQHDPVSLYLDATGVGAPVVDMMDAYDDDPIACFFTNGGKLKIDQETGEISIGKYWLVSRLQALLQARRIHVSAGLLTSELKAMLEELRNYEIRIDDSGKDTYGAFAVGTHDDLVTAIGLSTFYQPVDYDELAGMHAGMYTQMRSAQSDREITL